MLTASWQDIKFKVPYRYFHMQRSLRYPDSLSVSILVPLFLSFSLSLSLLDPIGRNVFVGLIYLCRNICMYMEPTLYPHLVREPFTKRACTSIHAYEIMYVVVRLCTCLTSRIDIPMWGCKVASQTFRLHIHINVEFFCSYHSVSF